jgi:hypothetical protein
MNLDNLVTSLNIKPTLSLTFQFLTHLPSKILFQNWNRFIDPIKKFTHEYDDIIIPILKDYIYFKSNFANFVLRNLSKNLLIIDCTHPPVKTF